MKVENRDGKIYICGQFGMVDRPSASGRIYPREHYEKALAAYQAKIENRTSFGVLGDTAELATSTPPLKDASHLITKLEIDDHGRVMGTAEILDTPNGAVLRELLKRCGEELQGTVLGVGSVSDEMIADFEVVSTTIRLRSALSKEYDILEKILAELYGRAAPFAGLITEWFNQHNPAGQDGPIQPPPGHQATNVKVK